MIINFVIYCRCGPWHYAAARFYPRLTTEPKKTIRSFENRLSQNSDRAKGVPRTRIFHSNAAFGYFRSLIWPLR